MGGVRETMVNRRSFGSSFNSDRGGTEYRGAGGGSLLD